MKYWSKWLLLFALVTFPTTGMAKSYALAAIEDNPYQKAIGHLLRDAFSEMGHTLIVTYLPGKRALVMSNAGYLDGEVARVATTSNSYPNLIKVPVAIGQFKATAITYQAPDVYENFEQFKPYRLGILRGVIWSEKWTYNYSHIYANNYNEMIRMLKVNRFAYAFGDHAIFTQIKKTTNDTFKILEPPIFQYNLYPFIHKSHAALIPDLVNALKQIDMTEGLDTRLQRYFHSELQHYLKN